MIRPVALLKLTRFPLAFTAVADSATAYLLVTGGGSPSWPILGTLAVSSASLYMAGMVLNDVADAERDRTRHPERPIPAGQVSRKPAAVFGALLVALALGVAAASSLPLGAGAAGVVALILAYNFVTKERGWVGALTMGGVRAANFGLGLLAGGAAAWIPAAILGLYVTAITRISQHEEAAGARRPVLMKVVLWGVLGIILLDAAFLLAAGQGGRAAAVAALLVPALLARPLFRQL